MKYLRIGCLCALFAFSGCGGSQSGSETASFPTTGAPGTPGGPVGPDGFIVKAKASFDVIVTPDSVRIEKAADSKSASIPINVTVAASTTMSVDTSKFIVPTVTSDLLDFGTIAISALKDNNLKVCGTTGNQHCSTALIRMYTTGQNGAGLWNSTDGYGAPITAGFSGGTMSTVGLNVAGAAVLESYSIPGNKNVIHLSDFSPAPNYDVKVDFSNAGVGTYQTTLVIEYAVQ